jgi:(2Fe-2S) ferredoxin
MTEKSEKPQPPRVIICNGEHCNMDGAGMRLYEHLDAILDRYDLLDPPFKLRTANCFDMCKDGPNMVIYPGNRRYNHLTIEKVDAILAEEILTENPARR